MIRSPYRATRNFLEALRPVFLRWFPLMWLTASTEVAPGQWIPSLITNLTVAVLPAVLAVIFATLFFHYKSGGGYRLVTPANDRYPRREPDETA